MTIGFKSVPDWLQPTTQSAQKSSIARAIVAIALLLSTFVPYAGIPLGGNTSLPLTSVLAVIMVPLVAERLILAIPAAGLAVFPVVTQFLSTFTVGDAVDFRALAIWTINTLPASALAAVVLLDTRGLVNSLRVGLWASSAYAVVQKYFLDQGQIPLLGYYSLPGFASVQDNADIIRLYVRRPFSFFPEPSFMAGSLVLAMAVLGLLVELRSSHHWSDLLLLTLIVYVVVLSASGSAIASVPLLVIYWLWPRLQGPWRVALLAASAVGTLGVASFTLDFRATGDNWSWDDRSASIIAALRYLMAEPNRWLFGLGQGSANALFMDRQITLNGLSYAHEPPDIYSMLGRILFENGVLVGGASLVILAAATFVGIRCTLGTVPAVCGAVVWLVVAGLTISYASAMWIWLTPACSFACYLLRAQKRKGVQGA